MPMTAAFAPLDALLQRPLSEVVPKARQVVSVHESSTVQVALDQLAAHNILSVVVLRPSKDGSGRFDWCGFVSYIDLIRFFSSKIKKTTFLSSTLNQVMSFSRSSPLQLELRSRVIDVVQFFGSLGRLHRCGVVDDANRHSICSQSDVVRFVVAHLFETDDLKAFANAKIASVGWGHRHPVSIGADQSLLTAINTLMQKNVSCVAVVDANGVMLANFSPSDLRGLGEGLLDRLDSPVGKFLQDRSPTSFTMKSESVMQSVGALLTRMAQQGLHHVWLEDADGKPEGLITLTDIMNMLLKFNPEETV